MTGKEAPTCPDDSAYSDYDNQWAEYEAWAAEVVAREEAEAGCSDRMVNLFRCGRDLLHAVEHPQASPDTIVWCIDAFDQALLRFPDTIEALEADDEANGR